ncbi:MAG TPA: ABC transporter ATP-binding protein [Ktedonobacterales bacterium]|nr:ABC transporter ATP-binding protein [Ktedonobacterales bacterium]
MMTKTINSAAPARVDRGDIVLQTRDLTKRYGERLAVDGLSLSVRRGEVFGFLGPNGAGKTTTIRMCLGLIAPTSGVVEMLGGDVTRIGSRVLPHVGALIEQPALYPYLSGRDNLRAIGDAQGGVSEARVDATLDLVALRDRGGDRVRTYSLGMKQRLGVAIALLQDPDLLVLDEPTNGLDPAGMVEMRELLRRLAAQGKTVFVSSHALDEVRQMCSRVAIINHGRLVTESIVADLIRGQGQFAVSLDRAAEALALVQAQRWGAHARLSDAGQLITDAPEGESGALNLYLVRGGFTPRSIAPYEERLEDVFLRLTADAATQADTVRGGAR